MHLEGTVRAGTLLEIAKRNDYRLPVQTIEDLAELYRFRDFRHFVEVWVLTTNALQRKQDFQQMVVDYAGEAKSHGAVYIEGILHLLSAFDEASTGRTFLKAPATALNRLGKSMGSRFG